MHRDDSGGARAAALALLLCLASAGGLAQGLGEEGEAATPRAGRAGPEPEAERIDITGHRDEVEERRTSTAAKIIVGRQEIEQYGDTTLADVLKRLPSVTIAGRPGRGGQIRMRGMGNGYTLILIDGERMPPGFSIDQLAPDQVERIEIFRAPTAEIGARAIAGAINIVLREPLRRRSNEVRAGLTEERGRLQPNLSWTREDAFGEHGRYNLNLSLQQAHRRTDTETDTVFTDLASGQATLAQVRNNQQFDARDSLHLTSRIQWQLGGGDRLTLQPFVVLSQTRTQTFGTLTQSVGANPAPYASSVSDGDNRAAIGRLLLRLEKNFGAATRLDLRATLGAFTTRADVPVEETDPATVYIQDSKTDIRDHSWSFNGKLSHQIAPKHQLLGGIEAEGVQRSETYRTLLSDGSEPDAVSGDIAASVLRLAAYAQDEWDPARNWSAYAGLRWESIQTRSNLLGDPVRNDSVVLSPLLHAVWRIDPPALDQIRFSLTRSYRAPTLANLTARPSLSSLYPDTTTTNPASSPDRAGNPGLRPELATGFDLAFEHYLVDGGVMSASVFRRDIEHLIRSVTALEAVSWASVPRWVTQPVNIGDAVSQGLEFDAKFRVSEVSSLRWPLTLRGNLSLYRSAVSGVQGPNNRIDQQPRASLNVGGEWAMRQPALMLGANFSWVPPYTVQSTPVQSTSYQMTRVADAFVLWTLDRSTKLRLSLGNLVPRNYITGSSIVAGGLNQTVVSDGPTYRVIGLRLEMRL